MESGRFQFVRSPLDHFFISLLVSDLILALGAIMNLRWVKLADVHRGSFCVAQGIFKQVGAVGVAITSAGIAIYTFLILFLRLNPPTSQRFLLAVDGFIWSFLIMIPLVASLVNTDPPYYGPSSHWCWIDPHYQYHRLGLQHAFMWFVALLNILLYIPLFLSLRGNIDVIYPENARGNAWRMRIVWRWTHRDSAWKQATDETVMVARQMLVYPIVYIILILPISVVRWLEPTRDETNPLPTELTVIAGVIFSASGLVNVLLYVITRPTLLPSWRSCHRRTDRLQRNGRGGLKNDVESEGESTMPEMTVISVESGAKEGTLSRPLSMVSRIPAVAPPTTGAPMLTEEDGDNHEEISEFVHSGSTAYRMQNPGGSRDINSGPERH
ncbi:hypothetical protein FRC03_006898 [Tulasnella sp. 419]|nr:hypothetical protein FRC03_006898 [Tulasnella sp. 419]